MLSEYQEEGVRVADYIKAPYKSLHGDLSRIYKSESVDRELRRAEKEGLVKRQIDKENVYVQLTNLGKQVLERHRKRSGYKPKLNIKSGGFGWDGKYRLVFFDIPEKDRIIRDNLRESLKEFGFVGWQQSVWITKNNFTKDLREFVKTNGLEDYILIIETNDLGNSKLERLLETK